MALREKLYEYHLAMYNVTAPLDICRGILNFNTWLDLMNIYTFIENWRF